MKCERFLEKLETGGLWERLGARLHLRRCSECQAVYRQLDEYKRDLSQGEPLPEMLRDRWLVAAETGAERVPPAAWLTARWVPVAFSAAFLAVAALGIWLVTHRAPEGPVAQELSGELAWSGLIGVRDGLGELSRELDQLAAQVSLLDEMEEVEVLLASSSIDRRSHR